MNKLIEIYVEQFEYDVATMSQPWMYWCLLIPIFFYFCFFVIKWAVMTLPFWLPPVLVIKAWTEFRQEAIKEAVEKVIAEMSPPIPDNFSLRDLAMKENVVIMTAQQGKKSVDYPMEHAIIGKAGKKGLHDDICAVHKGQPCNCPISALKREH